METHYVFDSPERFVVSTVGEPGNRAFYLFATGEGTAVTVAVEKQEVTALAEGLTVLLHEVRKSGGPAVTAPDGSLGSAADVAPEEPDFALDRLTVAWDGESVVVEAAATAPVAGPEVESNPPMSDEEAADEAAVLAELDAELEDVEVPVELELEQPVASLRVRLTLAQTAAFISHAEQVVSAGRQPCPLCGKPATPEGHLCPRLN